MSGLAHDIFRKRMEWVNTGYFEMIVDLSVNRFYYPFHGYAFIFSKTREILWMNNKIPLRCDK